ncbi:MAG: 2-dehydro-3-deoxy-phosphogluconate aldolase [Candidatus Hydrogenedentota bacterium]
MDKQTALRYMQEKCIIAVVRADTGGDELVKVIEAVAAGGVHCIELTMTTPGALQCIETASRQLKGADALLGVGTVLDGATCRMAILAGAQFVVTPTLSLEVIQTARRYGVPVVAGGYTPTELLTAYEAGSDMVKLFPANVGGPEYLKAIKGPLPHLPIVPTGGVDLDTIKPFLDAGASALGAGGNLVSKKLMAAKDYAGLTKIAQEFAAAVKAARSK